MKLHELSELPSQACKNRPYFPQARAPRSTVPTKKNSVLAPGLLSELPRDAFEGPEPNAVGNFNTGASGDSPRRRAFSGKLPSRPGR